MDAINSERKDCVMMGDFNIDMLKFGHDSKANEYIVNVFFRAHGACMPLILKPTRVTPSSATLIDHVYLQIINTQELCQIAISISSNITWIRLILLP